MAIVDKLRDLYIKVGGSEKESANTITEWLAKINTQLGGDYEGAPSNIEDWIDKIEDVWSGSGSDGEEDTSWIVGDGKTRFHISIPEGIPDNRRKFELAIASIDNDSANVDLDWGDGVVITGVTPALSTGSIYRHAYAATGDFVVTITVNSGTIAFVTDTESNYERLLIRRIEIGDSVTTIDDNAFSDCYSLTSITIPDGVTTIGEGAFLNCYKLTSIAIHDGVTTIGDGVFSYCSSLTSITIPDGVTTIGNGVFSYCSSLTSITIPDGVTTIGHDAFSDCYSLTSITIPDGVTTIGNAAFLTCFNMSEYHLNPVTPPSISNTEFTDMPSDCIIYVPEEAVSTYKNATNWSAYADQIQAEPAS